MVGARLAENGLGYLFPVFTLSYMTQTLGMDKSIVLAGIMSAHALADHHPAVLHRPTASGGRPVYMGAALFSAVWAIPFFLLVNTGTPVLVWFAPDPGDLRWACAACSDRRRRTSPRCSARGCATGFALARELGSILAGGPAPFIAALLLTWWGGAPWGVAGYIIVLSLITATAVYFGPETYRAKVSAESNGRSGAMGSIDRLLKSSERGSGIQAGAPMFWKTGRRNRRVHRST